MRIRFETLAIQCREAREVISFAPRISFFHGQISAGKSSILRLLDYCLGGRLEWTPALSQELVSAELNARVGEYQVLFYRDASDSNAVHVTWKNDAGRSASVLAPLRAASRPIWNDCVYNLSDLLFYLAGLDPIKVRKSKRKEDSPLVRLSFRDLMWYCYLEQDDLDSSFYQLGTIYRKLKSRDAMRFITGFYTERWNELEIRLEAIREERSAKLEAAKQVREFLQQYAGGLEREVNEQMEATQRRLASSKQELAELHRRYEIETHFADDLRRQLRQLGNKLAKEEQALEDLEERISEQVELRAELLSARFKLARAESASSVLSGVEFLYCPACGADLQTDHPHRHGTCDLCGRFRDRSTTEPVQQAEIVRRDLGSRVEELDESLTRHRRALEKQLRRVGRLRQRKAELDSRLSDELSSYDSAYVSQSRELERRIATLEERQRGLEKTVRMLEAVDEYEREASQLAAEENRIKREIAAEKRKLTDAQEVVEEIEDTYLEALVQVGVPGVAETDEVEINRKTWIPKIIPREGDPYTFYDAGSGGKKTLLNVCYALSVHQIAAKYDRPLPTFLMIDTPMKNIGEDVNENIFRAFYEYVYHLASDELSGTQFVIVDKNYFAPGDEQRVSVVERFMSPDRPLIPYYRGP